MEHKIRIIAGSARGRWLYSPAPPKRDPDSDESYNIGKSDATRPMLGRVKNSLFNIITPHLEGAVVLDLFAGTGALGLESLSRGAESCIFFEKNKEAFELLQKNISRLGFEKQSETHYLNAFYAVELLKDKKVSADIIFISPPYKFFDDTAPEKDRLLEIIDEFIKENILNKDGLIIIEHQKRQLKGLSFKYLSLYKERNYGDIILSFFTV